MPAAAIHSERTLSSWSRRAKSSAAQNALIATAAGKGESRRESNAAPRCTACLDDCRAKAPLTRIRRKAWLLVRPTYRASAACAPRQTKQTHGSNRDATVGPNARDAGAMARRAPRQTRPAFRRDRGALGLCFVGTAWLSGSSRIVESAVLAAAYDLLRPMHADCRCSWQGLVRFAAVCRRVWVG